MVIHPAEKAEFLVGARWNQKEDLGRSRYRNVNCGFWKKFAEGQNGTPKKWGVGQTPRLAQGAAREKLQLCYTVCPTLLIHMNC